MTADASSPTGAQRASGMASTVWRKLKAIDLNPETAFKPKRPPPATRNVMVNLDLPPEAFDAKGRVKKSWVYVTNQIKSSKYTIYNFVFKNLLEQFRRVANVFFLGMWFGSHSPCHSPVLPRVYYDQPGCGYASFAHCLGHHHDQGRLRGH